MKIHEVYENRRIMFSPLISCDGCIWNYEGECNLSQHSGFKFDYDRYADDDDEEEYKPCKYRLEFFDFADWFIENYRLVLAEGEL